MSLHFVLSASLWIRLIVDDFSMLAYVCTTAWPCFGLLALALVSFVTAIRHRRTATALLLATVILAAIAFWYDVSHQRWQWRVIVATREYLESHPGRPEHYFTWWWY